MRDSRTRRSRALIGSVLLPLLLSGCAGMISRATEQFSQDLEDALLGYDDPATVAQALPAYLLLLEARLESRPDDVALRLATARLTGAYAGLFAADRERARRLSRRALTHARAGTCVRAGVVCELSRGGEFELFEARLTELTERDIDPAYVLGTAWAGWIRAHSDDFVALSDLPHVEALLARIGELAPAHDNGGVWLYLGVLNSQRPPAAGGRPEQARAYFQRADEAAGRANLLVPLFMADSYARLTFDRDLFTALLQRVVESESEGDPPGLTLTNQVARQRARDLLAITSDIFD